MRFICDSKSLAKSRERHSSDGSSSSSSGGIDGDHSDSEILFAWISACVCACVSRGMPKTALSRPDAHLNRSLKMKTIRKFFIMSISINSMEFKTTHYLIIFFSFSFRILSHIRFCCIRPSAGHGRTKMRKNRRQTKFRNQFFFYFSCMQYQQWPICAFRTPK